MPQSSAAAGFNLQEAMGGPPVKVLLLDVSGSMASPVNFFSESGEPSVRKIEMLKRALASVLDNSPRIILAFDSRVELLESISALPEPRGSTDLALALKEVKRMKAGHVLLVSDGIPDSPEAAFEVAAEMRGCMIDTLYIGPETDYRAKQFLRDLAYRHRGRPVTQNMAKGQEALAATLQQLLTA